MNLLCLDPAVARETRLRLWAEHLEATADEVGGDPAALVDERWRPIAEEQLQRLEDGEPLTHRLVMLPGVSRRRRRVLGPMQSRLFDL
jgi:hypothetical protein